MQIDGKQIKNASIDKNKVAFTSPVSPNDPATKDYVDLTIKGLDPKQSVRAATTTNIVLSGLQTIDGVALSVGDFVLAKNQTTGASNGIYIANASTWVRRDDADTSAKVTSGMMVYVEEGTANGTQFYKLTTPNPIVLSTTALTFSVSGSTYYATPTKANKSMVATATSSDFSLACATTIAATPAQGSYVRILINGVPVSVGDGLKTSDAYFSADGGTTARTIISIQAGDSIYWVGSVAGYQLSTSDRIDLDYAV
jgi:phage-related tail fiber protein